ncbi:protein arginine N-methyltransferase 5 [Lepeophtheirus salmonis]|uniref:protein arginine N-methyltransferase 5 n=1 Tax=Lepeophtheirus salmonis TaxID=72036 RepID=UPI001AE9E41A|nr:protein arginine N-methyltransferase 5-like [Lepeophtheirus salmonis]
MNVSHHCSSGLWLKSLPRLPEALEFTCSHGFDFLLGPLVHPRYRQEEVTDEPDSGKRGIRRKGPFTRSDLLLTSVDWGSLFVGVLSRDVNLESRLRSVRRQAEERMTRELRYAAHLGLSAVFISLRKPHNTNLARILCTFLLKTSAMQVWIHIPFYDESTWAWWNDFRGSCNHDRRVFLALELSTNDQEMSSHILNRWLGEPVKALILNTSLFLTNKKGYPVLPRCIQKLMRHFFSLDVQCVLEGRNRGREYRLYQQYLDHLWQQFHAVGSGDPLKQFAKGYEDHLQTPLQPLSDNLESATYEVFEKDPVKYREYEKAIFKAIVDKIPEEEKETKSLVVMVLGAGRGPLVRAALRAAEMALHTKIRIFAVEKNPNAVVTLLAQKEEDWKDSVEVISSDMRDWNPEEENKADIVISELLGSFGDNELSPECLYSAQRVLKSDAISIPSSYTSFISPIQSSKLYNEVRFSFDKDKNMISHFETPYVVHFQNCCELAAPQPLFKFDHPLYTPIDNNRYDVKTFDITYDSELHGFGGYFECVLYKDVMISINPSTHSKGMFSWFPIFFPLKTPVKLKKDDQVELHFWRINNGKNVWYEWCLSKPIPGPIHNPIGRSYTIGL